MTFISNDLIKRNFHNVIPINHALKSEAIQTLQSEHEMASYWKEELKNFHLGYHVITRELSDNPNISEKCTNSNIEINDCWIKQSDLQTLKDPKTLEQLISGSITLQKLWNKSASILNIYYLIGNDLFYQKKSLDALNVFSFLTLMNQTIPCFWIGKGAANEELQNWDKALGDYWMGQALNPEDVPAYQALIRLYTKLKDEDALQECFQIMEAYPEVKKELLKEG